MAGGAEPIHSMSTESRDRLIDEYFSAMDGNDPSLARSALSDAFVYESRAGVLEGFTGLSDYITDIRSLTNTDHRVDRRIHGEDASAVEGVVAGDASDGERVEAKFCDVVEFDADEEAITRIAVYVNDA